MGASFRQHPRCRGNGACDRFDSLGRHHRPAGRASTWVARVLRVGVSLDATHTVVAACIDSGDGAPPLVQIVDDLPGTGEAPARLLALQERYGAPICIDRRGPSAALADVLATTKSSDTFEPVYRLTDMKAGDAVTAPQSFVSALEQHNLSHATDHWPTSRCAWRRNEKAATHGFGTVRHPT